MRGFRVDTAGTYDFTIKINILLRLSNFAKNIKVSLCSSCNVTIFNAGGLCDQSLFKAGAASCYFAQFSPCTMPFVLLHLLDVLKIHNDLTQISFSF